MLWSSQQWSPRGSQILLPFCSTSETVIRILTRQNWFRSYWLLARYERESSFKLRGIRAIVGYSLRFTLGPHRASNQSTRTPSAAIRTGFGSYDRQACMKNFFRQGPAAFSGEPVQSNSRRPGNPGAPSSQRSAWKSTVIGAVLRLNYTFSTLIGQQVTRTCNTVFLDCSLLKRGRVRVDLRCPAAVNPWGHIIICRSVQFGGTYDGQVRCRIK